MQITLSTIPTPYGSARLDADICTFLFYAVKYLTSLAVISLSLKLPNLLASVLVHYLFLNNINF
jgi:hypothetical protein